MRVTKCYNDTVRKHKEQRLIDLLQKSSGLFTLLTAVVYMILKQCNKCGEIIPYGTAYCPKCKTSIADNSIKAKQANDRRYNNKRDKKYIRFYNSKDWKMLAAKYTQDHEYRCEHCGEIATQVHHKVPIQTECGWALRLKYENLELLCTRCHNAAHGRFVSKTNAKKF